MQTTCNSAVQAIGLCRKLQDHHLGLYECWSESGVHERPCAQYLLSGWKSQQLRNTTCNSNPSTQCQRGAIALQPQSNIMQLAGLTYTLLAGKTAIREQQC